MRTLCWWSLVGAAALALVGCSSSTPTSPTGQADLNDLYDATAPTQGGSVENASGHYRVHIDVASLTGYAIDVNRSRQGAAQGDLSFLSANEFFSAGPVFELVSLGLDASVPPNVVMTYSCSHPFGAPTNLAGPSNPANNRADLSATGRMLFITDVPGAGDDYDFDLDGDATDETHLNPAVVKNADGYYDPAGMLNAATFGTPTATHFPYKVLVDESADPRSDSLGVAIPNNIGTVPTGAGNWAVDGWQQGNIGANRNGWTGYGSFHAGQTSTSSVVFDPDAAVGGSFDLDLLFIAKYTQPKGGLLPSGEKPRLPQSPVATATFSYCMPFGALDNEKVECTAPGTLDGTGVLPLTCTLNVIDQDFAVVPGGTFPTTITDIPNASGIASINAASSELGFQATVTVTATGTGAFDSPATQTFDVANTAVTAGGADAGAWVVVEVTDEEDGVETAFTLSGNPPAPVTPVRRPQVLQAFFVDIA